MWCDGTSAAMQRKRERKRNEAHQKRDDKMCNAAILSLLKEHT